MEEKEVTFNIVTELDDEGNTKRLLGVTSDIDDCLDYLSIEDRTCLITQLISQSVKLIDLETVSSRHVVEFDENDDEHMKFTDKMTELMGKIIYMTVNAIHNFEVMKFGGSPRELEFSLSTYTKNFNLFGMPSNDLEFTIHSDDVTIVDPIQSAFSFYMDVVKCLLEDDVPKESIKKLVNESLSAIKDDCMNEIENFNN